MAGWVLLAMVVLKEVEGAGDLAGTEEMEVVSGTGAEQVDTGHTYRLCILFWQV